jgi:hypothetical protein
MSDKQHTAARPSGHIIITGPGGTIERDTLQCCHCQKHWVVQPGSGRRRGFCLKCMKPTCGAEACQVCDPSEKKLERVEKAARYSGVSPDGILIP